MAPTPPWLELPAEVLGAVFRSFCSFADHFRASAVCSQWRAAAVANAPLLPLLVLPPTAAPATIARRVRISDVCWLWGTTSAQNPPRLPSVTEPAAPVFLRIFGEDVHRLPTFPYDAPRGLICGCFPGGWVFLALEQGRGCCLLNLYTR
ncbi:hypothetical protein C2845_PM09G22850 [Panicum miliaceum]|uniref:F-box domain-containing protein n=1 Tax=Panicum miliaceum TaxID=4540 RepID=A0A3L6RYC5_PANMI|nr:hypothetical protein C2845_PM09G22850 [Panicum miliaceum]